MPPEVCDTGTSKCKCGAIVGGCATNTKAKTCDGAACICGTGMACSGEETCEGTGSAATCMCGTSMSCTSPETCVSGQCKCGTDICEILEFCHADKTCKAGKKQIPLSTHLLTILFSDVSLSEYFIFKEEWNIK